MKKLLTTLTLLSLFAPQISAVRAYPHPRTIKQSDGTTLTIIGHGDEFSHHTTTTDGYTVLKGEDGIYRYAIETEGEITISSIKSNNESERSAVESSFLKSIPKHLESPANSTALKLKSLSKRTDSYFSKPATRRVDKKRIQSANQMQGEYRGLVVLVNFNDCKFSRGENAHKLVDEMMNGVNRTSYADPLMQCYIECTGSVRDYFSDNSSEQFVPQFDVVGPIDLPESQFFINGTENTYELCREVLESIDEEIDFSRYDYDGDGEMDMVYILYSGHSSSYQGNDERLIWPHAGHFEDSDETLVLDGTRIGRFACSSELFGWTDDTESYLDGIGVIVHEFSHVLGFKDHYDVSGYLNEDPGTWDVMASGNYNGVLNDTPCGYNSYEKYSANFISPRTITQKNDGETISLKSFYSSNEAIRFESMQDSTVFMVENRQPEKWDYYLPGHGMLVWRVDSCDSHYWQHNALNVNNRLHFKLIRANGATFNLFHEVEDSENDPFPGARNITELTNFTLESDLLTDLNYPSSVGLFDITEKDGVVSLRIESDPYADKAPYTFSMSDTYSAKGLLLDDGESPIEWIVTTAVVPVGNTEKKVIYNLAPDTRNISAIDPKYADGLGATYLLGSDKLSVIIEPYRVAVNDDKGIWLMNFTDLDNGGSGAIQLSLDPYGNIELSDPESVIGYCTMPKTQVVADASAILERFSLVKNITFSPTADITGVTSQTSDSNRIYNLQGIQVKNPTRGNVYIINGKKVMF